MDFDRLTLCSDCAVKADFAMQTGQGCSVPEKYTCEGCGQDVTFVVMTPTNRRLLLAATLAVEEEENANKKT